MKAFRLLAPVALLISVQLISVGCGKIIFAEKYITYVNEKDTNQFVDFEAAQPSLRSWWHNVPLEPRPEGSYTRAVGKQKISGSYWLEGDSYLLKSPDGLKESRFSIQPDFSLKDDKGEMWHRPIRVVRAEKKSLVSISR